jgi:hypothetical protein
MERRSQLGLTFRSRAEICRERSLAAGWRTLGDRLSRRLWFAAKRGAPGRGEASDWAGGFWQPADRTGALDSGEQPGTRGGSASTGRFLMRVHLRELLETRLRLTQAWSGQLKALDASLIQRPVFITGMPRSGSTFLHELLAEDPKNRVPRVWEVMFPVSVQNKVGSEVDTRVRKAEACLWWFRRLAPGADAVYPMRAWSPHECVAIHSTRCCPKNLSRFAPSPLRRRFCARRTLAPDMVGRNAFCNICSSDTRPGDGF